MGVSSSAGLGAPATVTQPGTAAAAAPSPAARSCPYPPLLLLSPLWSRQCGSWRLLLRLPVGFNVTRSRQTGAQSVCYCLATCQRLLKLSPALSPAFVSFE